MPSKPERIVVPVDAELSAALSAASASFPPQDAAATLRELALIGAETLRRRSGETGLDRIRSIPGVRPARRNMSEYLRTREPIGPVDPEDPCPLSRALGEQRQERL